MISQRSCRLMMLGFLLAGMMGSVNVARALEVGAQAPDFTLPSTTGEPISLSQFRGKSWSSSSFTGSISRRPEWRTSRPGRPTTPNSRS